MYQISLFGSGRGFVCNFAEKCTSLLLLTHSEIEPITVSDMSRCFYLLLFAVFGAKAHKKIEFFERFCEIPGSATQFCN